MNDPNHSEEVRQQLLREIASMKKQSVFSLIFAIICVIAMVFLFFKLRQTNRKLTNAKEKLAHQNLLLQDQKVALTNIKNELDAWRMSLLEVDSIPADVEPEPIMMPEEMALSAEPEPVIQRPTIPARTRKYEARRSQTSDNAPMMPGRVAASRPEAIQAAPEPMVVHQQVQHYDLKKQKAVSKAPLFGYIIYIQDAKKRAVSAELQKLLKEKGAIVPAIQSRNLPARFGTSIKYFHKQDERNAQGVRKLLSDVLSKNKIRTLEKDIPIRYVSGTKVSLGQLEVWIGN